MQPNLLSLYSEPYSPSGNLAADGFRKLLGTPTLDLLQTVVREAVQNSCDASISKDGTLVRFRLRRLSGDQILAMRRCVFRELPAVSTSAEPLSDYLFSPSPWVLEICDFRTRGLSGPTRADIIASKGDRTDFVDFLRNVGSPRDTKQGGGTYGYGKTSLYLSSKCSTIIVDSLSTQNGKPVRRLMGCHLGLSYQTDETFGARRFTGRHWWGHCDLGDLFVEPVQGNYALAFAQALGLPERGAADSGTSIMILNPVFLEGDPNKIVCSIQEALLWFFWPRMLETTEQSRKVHFEIELDGVPHPVAKPELFPPLNIFAEAMNAIRAGDSDNVVVRCERPGKDLGLISVRKAVHSTRRWLTPASESLIPERTSHIAVMRPVELVVRYFTGEPMADPNVEWAGVFLSSSDAEVESAFAAAEPPAHDDWQPSLMPKGPQRTYVNVALQRIKELSRSVAGPITVAAPEAQGGPSLARTAHALGGVLGTLDDTNSKQAKRQKKRTQTLLAKPRFVRLEMREHGPAAIYSTSLKASANQAAKILLRATAGVVIDGAMVQESGELGSQTPFVQEWRRQDGEQLGYGPECELEHYNGVIEIAVGMPGEFAVGLSVEILAPEGR